DLIVIDGKARGIVARDLISGKIQAHVADAVVLGTGGYGNVFFLSTNAKGSNCTAIWRAYKRGAALANPCFTQIHPTCIPVSGEDPYRIPMRIYPAIHYTMGGLWVDYQLMSTIPGLFVIGEANFSDHGANRLGASALMQGLADGYFILPYTIGDYLASTKLEKVDVDNPKSRDAANDARNLTQKLLSIKGTRSVDSFHRELGKLLWEYCGMARNEQGLEFAL